MVESFQSHISSFFSLFLQSNSIADLATLFMLVHWYKSSLLSCYFTFQTAPPKECYEVTPETVLDEVPKELVNIMPVIESKIRSAAAIRGFKVSEIQLCTFPLTLTELLINMLKMRICWYNLITIHFATFKINQQRKVN